MSSSRWASKPALTKIISGLNASSLGIHIISMISRMSMPRVYAATGTLTMLGAGSTSPL